MPDPPGTTGWRFDPADEAGLGRALQWMAERPPAERDAMGRRAAEVVAGWGPDRFAEGLEAAVGLARTARPGPRMARAG